MPHYRAGDGSLDSAVTDGFDASRPVILFDNAGVDSLSAGISRNHPRPPTRNGQIPHPLEHRATRGRDIDRSRFREHGDSKDLATGVSSLEVFLYLSFRPSPSEPGCGDSILEAPAPAKAGRGSAEYAADDGCPTRGSHGVE